MDLSNYRCRAIGVLVTLHEQHLRQFLKTWTTSRVKNIPLPETSDPDYESLHTLLFHVFNSSRNYMIWITRHLKLEDPHIKEVPLPEEIESLAADYLEHLVDKWKYPLMYSQEVILDNVYKSNWGVDYSIEAMLEHAVMHTIRHDYQLQQILKKS